MQETDYGKLAYMKVEDLENSMQAVAKRTFDSSKAYFSPYVSLCHLPYEMTDFICSGVVAIIARINLNAVSPGVVTLFIDDKCVGAARVEVGKSEKIILGSAKTSGGRLRLVGGFNCDLENAEIILVGDGAFITRYASDICAVESADKICLVSSVSDSLGAFVVDKSDPRFITPVNVGVGSIVDALAFENFLICYADSFDNMWGVVLNSGGEEIMRECIGDGCESIALCSYGATVIIAYVKNGEVFYKTANHLLGAVSGEHKMELQAERVSFVKNADPPIMVVQSEKNCFIRFCEKEINYEAGATIRLSIEVTGTV